MASGLKRKLFTPPSLRAAVWVNFGFEVTETDEIKDKGTAYCRHCGASIRTCGNTTNISQHLLRCTNYITRKAKSEGVQPGIPDHFKPVTPMPSTSNRAREISDGIVRYIATDLKPFSTVQGKGFAHLMGILAPNYVIPTRNTAVAGVTALANAKRTLLATELEDIEYLALTLDYWSSLANQSYLGVTCHYINSNWELEGHTLGTYLTTDSHSSENVASHINDTILEWDVGKKCVAIVTDSAANMVGAMELIEPQHVRCSAHLLQLAVKKGFENISASEILAKGRKIVGHFRKSPLATEKLSAAQRERNIPENKLVQDVVTRWNSSRDMLFSLEKNRSAINDVLDSDDRTSHLMITFNEKKRITQLHELLEPFGELTTLFGGETYVSASIVIPAFSHFIRRLLTIRETDAGFIKDMKKRMSDDLKRRIVTLLENKVLLLAYALDPRFKRLSFLDTVGARDEVWAELKVQIIQLRSMAAAETNLEEQASDVDEPNKSPKKRRTLMQDLDSASSTASGGPLDDDDAGALDEVLQYQMEKKIAMDKDPLLWWRKHADRWPMLSLLAKRYLCVPATSVPSERLFSTGGNIITKNRSRLSGENVNNLLFLHSYLKNEKKNKQE